MFHIAEAAYKLLVGAFQSQLGVYAVETCHIDECEEQVAYLARQSLLVFGGYLRLHLTHLLLHFVPHILAFLPVEACRGCLLAHAESLHHCGQRAGHATEQTALTLLLTQLESLPVLLHLVGCLGVYVAVYVGVAVYELVALGICYVAYVE